MGLIWIEEYITVVTVVFVVFVVVVVVVVVAVAVEVQWNPVTQAPMQDHKILVVLVAQPRSQGLSSYRPLRLASGGGKMRDPGNEVGAFADAI